jgi:hypothetical protein
VLTLGRGGAWRRLYGRRRTGDGGAQGGGAPVCKWEEGSVVVVRVNWGVAGATYSQSKAVRWSIF